MFGYAKEDGESDNYSDVEEQDENESETEAASSHVVEQEELIIEDSDVPNFEPIEQGIEVLGETDTESNGDVRDERDEELAGGLQNILDAGVTVEEDLPEVMLILFAAAVLKMG
jgi:hypothetical protein